MSVVKVVSRTLLKYCFPTKISRLVFLFVLLGVLLFAFDSRFLGSVTNCADFVPENMGDLVESKTLWSNSNKNDSTRQALTKDLPLCKKNGCRNSTVLACGFCNMCYLCHECHVHPHETYRIRDKYGIASRFGHRNKQRRELKFTQSELEEDILRCKDVHIRKKLEGWREKKKDTKSQKPSAPASFSSACSSVPTSTLPPVFPEYSWPPPPELPVLPAVSSTYPPHKQQCFSGVWGCPYGETSCECLDEPPPTSEASAVNAEPPAAADSKHDAPPVQGRISLKRHKNMKAQYLVQRSGEEAVWEDKEKLVAEGWEKSIEDFEYTLPPVEQEVNRRKEWQGQKRTQ